LEPAVDSLVRAICDNAGAMMGVVELGEDDILHIYDNPATASFFGTTAEAMRNQWASRLGAPPQVIRLWLDRYRESDQCQASVQFEYKHPAPLGQKTFSVRVGPIAAPPGAARRYYYVLEDISYLKQTEDDLRKSNELLETIRDLQADFIARSDPERAFERTLAAVLAVSQSEYGFIGEVRRRPGGEPFLVMHAITDISWSPETRALYDRRKAAGMEFSKLDSLYGAVLTSSEVVIANEPAADLRSGGLAPGHPPLRSFLGLPVHVGGEMLGVIGVANRPGGYCHSGAKRLAPLLQTCGSIIDAIRAERRNAALAAEQRRQQKELVTLSAALTAAANGIVITSPEGVIQWVNPAFTKMTGYSKQEAVGQTPRLLKSGDHPPSLYESLWRTILSGDTWRGQLTNRRKDGSLYREHQTITPVLDANGRISSFIAVKVDASEREHLEEQVRQAQKMDAVGQLAGGVAHDFNNLLTVINAYADLLLEDLPADSPIRDDLEQIGGAGRRAAQLTQQLLAFGRKQVLQPKILDLHEIVVDAEKMLKRMIGEDVGISLARRGEHTSVKADPGQVVQVLMNLAVNARHAMPHGGKLTLETSVVDVSGPILGTDAPPGRYVSLEVKDTGVGMPPEVVSRIFEPFFTTKEPGAGTGLGLSVVHGIVTQSGGHIAVSSEPGRGTTFRVLLPWVDAEAEPDSPRSRGRVAGGTETVLVVEDEPGVRRLARTILINNGYTVLDASSGAEAFELAERHGASIHLLLTDVVMPGQGGFDLAQALRRRFPLLKVLFMSGYAPGATVMAGVGFLPKPFGPASLAQKVRATLDAPVRGGESTVPSGAAMQSHGPGPRIAGR